MTASAADIELATIEGIVERDTDPRLVELIRSRVAAVLLVGPRPGAPASAEDRALADFVDQFVIDVSGIDDAQRGAVFATLGDAAMGFVQALYVIDLGVRRRIVLDRLGLEPPVVAAPSGIPDDLQLWPALERYMRTVAKMKALDPIMTELVRVRGAAAHHCRICSSRLSVQAVEQMGSDAPFLALLHSHATDLSERHAAAIAFVDAMITLPTELEATTIGRLRSQFSTEEVLEMIHDVVRNAANKFAVAVGGDAPVVNEGMEFFDIDAEGDVVADVDPDVVRAATRV